MSPRLLLFVLVCLGAWAPPARAADPCQTLPAQAGQSADAGERIAAAACTEHRAWFRPLIDVDGRIGAMRVREAERTRLADGQAAWERVVEYWRGSGLLWQAGAGDCAYGDAAATACRAFVVDTPWSAAFVSWVLRKARLPGFDGSGSHLTYVRRAYREPFLSPYRVADPRAAQVRAGDLLCYVRGTARTYGFGALATVLSGNEPGLAMHCDIVVGITVAPDHARIAHLVGGNVYDSVTMRRLRLTQGDRFADLPMRSASDPECSPESPYACDLNRQDWSVLLQLQPAEELAGLAPASTMPVAPGTYAADATGSPASAPAAAGVAGAPASPAPDGPRCCNHCDPEVGLPRCPATPPRPTRP